MAKSFWSNRRNMRLIIGVIVALVVGAERLYNQWQAGKNYEVAMESGDLGEVNALLMDNALQYTKHARCRMGCRFIDESEVEFIVRHGKVNERKSDRKDSPCPTFSLEGFTKDNQEVRIVFADCDNTTKVITAIDLGEDHKCHCK